MLSSDAARAEHDELTGLLTRRAFHRRAKARLEQGWDERGHFVIAVIDLDGFKLLNDNYGHSTGDDALVSVARALRDTTEDTAVICRSGGEEFVIADIWHPDKVGLRAQQLCDVIAGLSFGVTAGIHPGFPDRCERRPTGRVDRGRRRRNVCGQTTRREPDRPPSLAAPDAYRQC